MDIKAFLDLGIIEEYCLGLLSEDQAIELEGLSSQYPEIRDALLKTQAGLVGFVGRYANKAPKTLPGIFKAIDADRRLGQLTLSSMSNQLSEFMPITSHSDHLKWKEITATLQPPKEFDIHTHPIYHGSEGTLMVVWVDHTLPSEVHTATYESFLLLEGRCLGLLGDQPMEIHPGSFLNIPLQVPHSLTVISEEPAKLIVMLRNVA